MLGIVAALPQEIADLLEQMGSQWHKQTIGRRDYYSGHLYGEDCVIVLARIGKVAASASCVTLIREFNVDQIIFTGLAGGLGAEVNVGDIVLANNLCQYDMDASPLFPQYEIPLLGMSYFNSNAPLSQCLHQAAQCYIEQDLNQHISLEKRQNFNLKQVRIHTGLILSGDQFISHPEQAQDLLEAFPQALCTEMEGAALAQICFEYEVPFAVMRIISDRADHDAYVDFDSFLNHVARYISSGILLRFLQARSE